MLRSGIPVEMSVLLTARHPAWRDGIKPDNDLALPLTIEWGWMF
jgi:hypothetical protein